MMKYPTYTVGAKMPMPLPEGVRLAFNGVFMLICVVKRLTAKEKKEFKNGFPQFGVAIVNDIIFFLSRFGTLGWMDTPFNIHLYPDNRISLLEEPSTTQGYGLHVMLIDGDTGTLENLRLIGLDHDLSMRLHDAILHQPVIPNYDQRLQLTMERYTTADLVALSRNKRKADMTGTMDEAVGMPQLRPSHRGLTGIKKDNYPLPEELRKFNYYYLDTGHVVMAIPESLLPRATKSGNFDDYECPIPCRYILAKGYRFLEGYVVCDAPYDKEFGLDLDESWYEY